MYFKWLDRWDEQQSDLGLRGKVPLDFALGTALAFPGSSSPENLDEFMRLSEHALSDPEFYKIPKKCDFWIKRYKNLITFSSDVVTDIPRNNVGSARITDSCKHDHALIVFHHWGAEQRNRLLANLFVRMGITVVEMALPYHLERGHSKSDTDYFVSPNLGRTVQSLRQGVLDGRRLVAFLKDEGYARISVLGTSLGSWLAGLVAAHDPDVSRAALMLAGGNAADVVWTGRATSLVRQSLEPHVTLDQLQRAWSTTDVGNYADKLGRSELDLLLVLGRRDKVVLPEISTKFIEQLTAAKASPKIKKINCGHRSLARFPHNLMALLVLVRFFQK